MWIWTILLLILSNLFMTIAWYGHLRFPNKSLLIVILVSWGIAFFEYVIQVPANRIGYRFFSGVELKTIQEVITLGVFILFSIVYLNEPIKWNHLLGFSVILFGAYLVFKK